MTAYFLGWHGLSNGDLLNTAEAEGFDVFVTTDHSIQYQQNLTGRKIAILLLSPSDWLIVQGHLEEMCAAVSESGPGDFKTLQMA